MCKEINSFDEIITDAKEKCEGKRTLHNLFLHYSFKITLIDNPFEGLFGEAAKLWQSPTKPSQLQINHGSYIHVAGDGINSIVEELKRKNDSNRALYSLINMKDIVGSGDNPIPSFIILQFGKVDKTLYCTSYFRALEVSQFLPINLTEMCQVMQKIRKEFLELENVILCIHAFRAYYNPDFDCLRISELDLQPRGVIASYLILGEKERIRDLLKSKLKESSVIETAGIEEIYNVLVQNRSKTKEIYSDDFLNEIMQAKLCLERLKELRKRSSFSHDVQRYSEQFKLHLTEALRRL